MRRLILFLRLCPTNVIKLVKGWGDILLWVKKLSTFVFLVSVTVLYQNCGAGGSATGNPIRFSKATLKFDKFNAQIVNTQVCLSHFAFRLKEPKVDLQFSAALSNPVPVRPDEFGFDLAYLYQAGEYYYLKGFEIRNPLPLNPDGTFIGEYLLPEGTYDQIHFGFSPCSSSGKQTQPSLSYVKNTTSYITNSLSRFVVTYDQVRDLHAEEINLFSVQNLIDVVSKANTNSELESLLTDKFSPYDLVNFSMPFVTVQADNFRTQVHKILGLGNGNSIFLATGQWNHLVAKLLPSGQLDPTFSPDFHNSASFFSDMPPGVFAINKNGSEPVLSGTVFEDESFLLVTSTDRNEDKKIQNQNVFEYSEDAFFDNEDLFLTKYGPNGERPNSPNQQFIGWPFEDTAGTALHIKFPENSNICTGNMAYYCREIPGDSLVVKNLDPNTEETAIVSGYSYSGFIMLFKIKNSLPLSLDTDFVTEEENQNPPGDDPIYYWPKPGIKLLRASTLNYSDPIRMHIQKNNENKLIIMSTQNTGNGARVQLMRLDPRSGAADGSFASKNQYYRKLLPVNSNIDYVGAAITEDTADGDVYVLATRGDFRSSDGDRQITFWRMNRDGQVLGGAIDHTSLFKHIGDGMVISERNNQKWLTITGRIETPLGRFYTMTLLNAHTGLPDMSNGPNGVRIFYSDVDAHTSAILLQPDNSILIGGGFGNYLQYFQFK